MTKYNKIKPKNPALFLDSLEKFVNMLLGNDDSCNPLNVTRDQLMVLFGAIFYKHLIITHPRFENYKEHINSYHGTI
jgi:hypothetical protein